MRDFCCFSHIFFVLFTDIFGWKTCKINNNIPYFKVFVEFSQYFFSYVQKLPSSFNNEIYIIQSVPKCRSWYILCEFPKVHLYYELNQHCFCCFFLI